MHPWWGFTMDYVECFSALSTFVDIALYKMNHYDYYFAVTARKVWSKEETALLAAEFKHYIGLPAPSKNLPREFFTLTLNTPYQFQPAHTHTRTSHLIRPPQSHLRLTHSSTLYTGPQLYRSAPPLFTMHKIHKHWKKHLRSTWLPPKRSLAKLYCICKCCSKYHPLLISAWGSGLIMSTASVFSAAPHQNAHVSIFFLLRYIQLLYICFDGNKINHDSYNFSFAWVKFHWAMPLNHDMHFFSSAKKDVLQFMTKNGWTVDYAKVRTKLMNDQKIQQNKTKKFLKFKWSWHEVIIL